ncbi:MAG: FecR domain-containing protein [Elusimicrobia bacterium]|nr:FecR domain-containing protein [Elusimicrobiota bacterium]
MPVAALAVLLAASCAYGAESWTPQLGKVSGTVLVFAKGSDEGLPAEDGAQLEEGDRIETGEDSSAELALHQGSVMELGAGTSMTVESVKKKDSWFSLSLGSFIAKFERFAVNQRASVRTPTSVAAVRGTEFGVEVADDGETSIGVFDEGRVAVTQSDGDGVEETTLEQNQEVVLAPGEGPDTVSKGGKRFLRARALKRFEGRRARLERVRERREEIRKTWKDLPPKQRRELRAKWQHGMRERVRNMPPEQRQRLKEGFQRRQESLERRRGALEQLRQLPPEKRRQFGEKLRENFRQNMRENRPGGGERGGDLRERIKERRQERRDGGQRGGMGPGRQEDGMGPGRGQGGGQRQEKRGPGGRRDEQRGGGHPPPKR